MELPRSLARWEPELELFPAELILSLGPLVQRLDLLIGPLRSRSRAGQGEPDGFDGIARRGRYERLLISEWALAEEAPDEFARRAAMSEHGFLQLARREPAGERVSLAFFDAGPNQLGSPRLAHLAALIVLARRAEAAGAHFQWGILQQPDSVLISGLSQTSIRRLLEARHLTEYTETDLDRRFAEIQSVTPDDVWIIGGARMDCFPACREKQQLQVSDLCEPGAARLFIRAVGKGRSSREAVLDLPDEKSAVRLLRDPFEVTRINPQRAKAKYTPLSNLLFLPAGTKLLARTALDSLVVVPIPNSPRAGVGKPKLFRARLGNVVLAAGRMRGTTVAVTLNTNDGTLRLEGSESLGNLAGWEFSSMFPAPLLAPAVDAPLLPLFQGPSTGGDTVNLLVVIQNSLLRMIQAGKSSPARFVQIEAQGVTALTSVRTGIAYVGRSKNIWVLGSTSFDGSKRTHKGLAQGENAFFGYGGVSAHPDYGLLAVLDQPDSWRLYHAEGETVISVPSEGRVVGVIRCIGEKNRPSLVFLGAGRRTLSLIDETDSRVLLHATSDIKKVTVSLWSEQIAYVTESGDMVVYSLNYEANLVYIATGGSS